jgi:hypothetical protein
MNKLVKCKRKKLFITTLLCEMFVSFRLISFINTWGVHHYSTNLTKNDDSVNKKKIVSLKFEANLYLQVE